MIENFSLADPMSLGLVLISVLVLMFVIAGVVVLFAAIGHKAQNKKSLPSGNSKESLIQRDAIALRIRAEQEQRNSINFNSYYEEEMDEDEFS